MLLSEPPRTQGDLRFSLLGIPVRVHPIFWVIGLIFAIQMPTFADLFLCVAAIFIGIVVHELGHAMVMRHLGLRPWITLHGMGGLASYDTTDLYDSRASGWIAQIMISLAGPGAGLLMSAAIIAVLIATGNGVNWNFLSPPFGISVSPSGIESPHLAVLVWALLFVGVTWSVVNLLPVYPLDGGQVAREIFLRFSPRNGLRYSLILSIVVGAAMVTVCLWPIVASLRAGVPLKCAFSGASPFVALLFGYLAYSGWLTLQRLSGRREPW